MREELKKGERIEIEFLKIIQKKYPKARKIRGYWKDYDIYVPETGETYEVKYDIMSDRTGNFAFEYKHKGEWSGIATTKSNYWVQADEDYFYVFKTNDLKMFLRASWKYLQRIDGGDNKWSRLIIIDKDDITNRLSKSLIKRDGKRKN